MAERRARRKSQLIGDVLDGHVGRVESGGGMQEPQPMDAARNRWQAGLPKAMEQRSA